MNQFLRGVVRSVAESFDLPGPVLEIGSYQVDGPEGIIDLRSLFRGKTYVGIDFRAGPGVDCLASVEALPQATASAGTVIAVSTFEHVRRFWLGFEEVYRVLRPDGVLVVACPFYFHQHGYPSDYWRFTPQALEVLLEALPDSRARLARPGPQTGERLGGGVPRRMQAADGISIRDISATAQRYAREPLPWGRKLKYQIGRLICGRRPFAPHLDRERWETELQKAA